MANRTFPFTRLWPGTNTACDRYFASILGPTFPNRLFLHAAQTDRLTNSTNFTSPADDWDRLASAGVSANYFLSNVPFVAHVGRDTYLGISRLYGEFLVAAANGTLPRFPSSIRDTQFSMTALEMTIIPTRTFAKETCSCIRLSKPWPRDQSGQNTVFIVNFDEWGTAFSSMSRRHEPLLPIRWTSIS